MKNVKNVSHYAVPYTHQIVLFLIYINTIENTNNLFSIVT